MEEANFSIRTVTNAETKISTTAILFSLGMKRKLEGMVTRERERERRSLKK
ncbi:hypothetical protein LguiB_028103 [Lonicera macranthoides]